MQTSGTAKAQTGAEVAQVLGCGVLYDGSGRPFYVVSSQSEPGRVHLVTLLSAVRLRCDCRGYHYCGQCRHTRAVEALLQMATRDARRDRMAMRTDLRATRKANIAAKTETDSATPAPSATPETPATTVASDSDASREADRAQDQVRHATPAALYRQSSHPGDTALPRRNNKPFSLLR